MRIAIYLILTMLFVSSCKEKPTLESQVLAIHDEVMPKMGDIHLAKKKLKSVMTESQNDSLNTEVLQLINNLQKADEEMMQWMSNWEVPTKEPEKTKYLEGEKIKITKVKVDMLSSLEAADQYLSKINKK